MPQVLTFLMGLDLCWIICELSLRIKFSLMVIKSHMVELKVQVASPERCIKLGRIIVTAVLATMFVVASVTLVILGQYRQPIENRKLFNDSLSTLMLVMQVFAFILLTGTTTWLLILLNRQQKLALDSVDADVFKQERRTFFTIVFIFDILYILRSVCSEFFKELKNNSTADTLTDIFCGAIFDLAPLCMIMFIHTSNFKTIQS